MAGALISDTDFLMLAIMSEVLAVDTEGTDIDKTDYRDGSGHGFGVSMAFRFNGELYSKYFPIRHTLNNVDATVFMLVKNLVEKHPCVVFHNGKFDLVSLATMEINRTLQFYDTMLMAHWIDENLPSKGLDYLSKRVLGKEGKLKSSLFNYWMSVFGWHPDFPSYIMGEYAGRDAEDTLELFELMIPEFKKQGFDG